MKPDVPGAEEQSFTPTITQAVRVHSYLHYVEQSERFT